MRDSAESSRSSSDATLRPTAATPTAAYAVAVFQRASLGVAGVEAQHRFGITAAVLGLFGVLQLGVYAGLQVPVGVVLDRVGSRRLIATGAALMGIGQLVLATTHSVALAVVGRVLVGAGDAMTFISVLRLIAVWFPPRRVNGPGSLMAFDYARTENEAERIGSATGIVNLGGFVASLLTIALIGIVLSVSSAGGYTLHDFKLAFSAQYAFWAVGLAGLLYSRRRLRTVRGLRLDPFPRAVIRVWRGRRAGAS